jgi:hypothetical protein
MNAKIFLAKFRVKNIEIHNLKSRKFIKDLSQFIRCQRYGHMGHIVIIMNFMVISNMHSVFYHADALFSVKLVFSLRNKKKSYGHSKLP